MRVRGAVLRLAAALFGAGAWTALLAVTAAGLLTLNVLTLTVEGVAMAAGRVLTMAPFIGAPELLPQRLREERRRADGAARERDAAERQRVAAVREREAAVHERDAALRERYAALSERDAAARERDVALREREAAVEEWKTAEARTEAAEARAADAERERVKATSEASDAKTRVVAAESEATKARRAASAAAAARNAAVEEAAVLRNARTAAVEETAALRRVARERAETIGEATEGILRRAERLAARNVAAVPLELIPFAGGALIVAGVGWDIKDMCDTARDMDAIIRAQGLPPPEEDLTARICGYTDWSKEKPKSPAECRARVEALAKQLNSEQRAAIGVDCRSPPPPEGPSIHVETSMSRPGRSPGE